MLKSGKQVIHSLVSHGRLDQDEAVALFLARRFGTLVFADVDEAEVEFWKETPAHFRELEAYYAKAGRPERFAEQLEREGWLLVGTGNGLCDEHIPDGHRKIDAQGRVHCASSLVAELIGCDQNPVAARLVEVARDGDLRISDTPVGFARLIKLVASLDGDFRALAWADTVLAAVFERGEDFFEMNETAQREAGKRFADFVAVWLLSRFAEKECPTVASDPTGYLVFGIPPGLLTQLGIAEGDQECPATSIATSLDVNDIALASVLDFAAKRWAKPGGSIWELHSLLNLLFAVGRPIAEIWDWASLILDALWKEGLAFVENAGTDFEKASVREIFIPNGGGVLRSAKMAVGSSDCDIFGRYARSKHGCRADVVVQRRTTGNIVVMPDQIRAMRANLSEVAAIVRVEEVRAFNRNRRRGEAPRSIPLNPKALCALGTLPEVPEWHLFGKDGEENGGYRKTMGLFNGSLTHQAPPTRLSLDVVADLVQIGLNPQQFEPVNAARCQSGVCVGEGCQWFAWKLGRCRKVRFQMSGPRG